MGIYIQKGFQPVYGNIEDLIKDHCFFLFCWHFFKDISLYFNNIILNIYLSFAITKKLSDVLPLDTCLKLFSLNQAVEVVRLDSFVFTSWKLFVIYKKVSI